MSHYQTLIREELARKGQIGRYKAHQIEAFIRSEHSTLDHVVAFGRLPKAIKEAIECIDACGPSVAEEIAASYGLSESKS